MMKGIVLAGGHGKRLHPLTLATNKHLLPVGRKPMIFWPLQKLKEAGIEEVCVVTGREHMGDVVRLLGSGSNLGLDLTYRVQDAAGGIAEALGLCESFAGDSPVVVILGDNVFQGSIKNELLLWGGLGCQLFTKHVEDPGRFGVVKFKDGTTEIARIIEKPEEGTEPSNYAVIGCYAYDSQVWKFIRGLKRSERGELEITDVNNRYVDIGLCHSVAIEGWWSDAGTHPSYRKANQMAHEDGE